MRYQHRQNRRGASHPDVLIVVPLLVALFLCAIELSLDLMSLPLVMGAVVALLASYLVNRTVQE